MNPIRHRYSQPSSSLTMPPLELDSPSTSRSSGPLNEHSQTQSTSSATSTNLSKPASKWTLTNQTNPTQIADSSRAPCMSPMPTTFSLSDMSNQQLTFLAMPSPKKRIEEGKSN